MSKLWHKYSSNFVKVLFALIFVFSLIFFVYLLYKNISFPLLWNDEAETAMYGESILVNGYPKVHFDKNILNVSETKDKSLGVKKGIDAWIYISSWGQYYIAAPFVELSKSVGSMYEKTFILRLPFVSFGLLGILLLVLIPLTINIINKVSGLVCSTIFIIFEATSVPFILHLRQMRHYGLDVFLIGLYLFLIFRLFQKDKIIYQILLFVCLILLLNTYTPAFISLTLSTIVYYFLNNLSDDFHIKNFIKESWYVMASLLISIPYLIFFEFFKISAEISSEFGFTFNTMIQNSIKTIHFFWKYEYLYLYLVLLIFLLFKIKTITKDIWYKYFIYLNITFISFIVVSSKIPYFFERYIIIFQPLLYLLIIVGIIIVLENKLITFKNTVLGIYLLILLLLPGIFSRFNLISKYLKEIDKPFEGTTDVIVKSIYSRYKGKTNNLTIATNYEEYTLMYYLGSKVIVGYVGNNLEVDSKLTPDVIVIRKNRPNNVVVLENYLNKSKYSKVVYDKYDYLYNNVPDLELREPHLFEMPQPTKESDKLTIFYKNE